ncbi:hypothetical protein QEN19_000852 [Hanseniaspora menglaensis]
MSNTFDINNKGNDISKTSEISTVSLEETADEHKKLDQSNQLIEKKGSYGNFKVIKSNKDVVTCNKTGLPMIDLRDKKTNMADPEFHGLITNIKGHYEPLVKHVMGKGSFGEVFKGVNLQTNRLVAIKKLKIFETDEIFPITAQREIMILKKMEHVNVVTLSDVIFDNFEKSTSTTNSKNFNTNHQKIDPFMTEAEKNALNNSSTGNKKLPDRFFYMVLPYMVSDLAGVIHNPHFNIKMPQIKNMVQQILRGLDYVHKMKYFHRDIKTANILIDQYGVLKIADFGLSRIYYGCPPNLTYPGGSGTGIKFTPLVVTRWYRAPELVMFDRFYTTAIDIWGVGCILGEFFIKRPIFQGKTDIDQGHLIFQLMGKPDFDQWPTLKYLKQYEAHYSNKIYKGEYKEVFGKFLDAEGLDLFAKMMCLNPYKRITAAAALKHDWFNSVPVPSACLRFDKIMESHESDIDKFDKLKRELDIQKNKSKKFINHIHNDVTPEPQLPAQKNPNEMSTHNSKSDVLKLAVKGVSRFENTEPLGRNVDKRSVFLHKQEDHKKYDNNRRSSYNKGISRFETNSTAPSRFESHAPKKSQNFEETKFENRSQRTKKRFENQKPEENTTNFGGWEDSLNSKQIDLVNYKKNENASNFENKHNVPEKPIFSKEENLNVNKKRRLSTEDKNAIEEEPLKKTNYLNRLHKNSRDRTPGSIKGQLDDMYD